MCWCGTFIAGPSAVVETLELSVRNGRPLEQAFPHLSNCDLTLLSYRNQRSLDEDLEYELGTLDLSEPSQQDKRVSKHDEYLTFQGFVCAFETANIHTPT